MSEGWTKSQILFWLGAGLFSLALIWLFRGVLTPFVIGMAVAYLLNPPVAACVGKGVPRNAAVAGILVLFILLVALLLAMSLPPLYRETAQFVKDLPDFLSRLWGLVQPAAEWTQHRLGMNGMEDIGRAVKEHMTSALSVGGNVLGNLAQSGQAFAGLLVTAALSVLTSFFMLKDWPKISGFIEDLMPRRHIETIHTLWTEIDRRLAGFVRGQLTVCVVLGLLYAIALALAGLKYGVMIGILSGVLSIIPLVGSTVGLVVSVAVAWFQSGEWGYVALIAGIYLIGQVIEGNVITPRIMGKSVGLHPLWILFALMAGGAFAGIVGVFLAVPVAAVVSVLAGFALKLYRKSGYYNQTPQTAPLQRNDKKRST